MSATPGPPALIATLVGAAAPLALAHWGRSPSDRLRSSYAGPLAVATGLVAVWGLFGLWPDPLAYPPIPVVAFYGFLVGLWGLIAYGVVERLVLPIVGSALETDRHG